MKNCKIIKEGKTISSFIHFHDGVLLVQKDDKWTLTRILQRRKGGRCTDIKIRRINLGRHPVCLGIFHTLK